MLDRVGRHHLHNRVRFGAVAIQAGAAPEMAACRAFLERAAADRSRTVGGLARRRLTARSAADQAPRAAPPVLGHGLPMRIRLTGGEQAVAARIAAALRAGGLDLAEAGGACDVVLALEAGAPPERLRHGALALDPVRRRAWLGGERLALTPIEFALLAYLVRVGRPASRAELLRELWGYRFDPGTNSVAVHVSRLRAKVGRGAIETRGDSYRLAGEEPAAESAPLR